MSTRVEPVQLYSRRHFVFLGLGIAASGALDPWRLFAGTDELRYTFVDRSSALVVRLDQLRHASHDAVLKAIHHEADLLMAEAMARRPLPVTAHIVELLRERHHGLARRRQEIWGVR